MFLDLACTNLELTNVALLESLGCASCVRKPVLSAVLSYHTTFFRPCLGGRSAKERPEDVSDICAKTRALAIATVLAVLELASVRNRQHRY